MKRQRQIKLKDITKEFKSINTLSTHVLNKEDNIVIKYYKVFDNKRVEELMKEAYSNLEYDNVHNLGFFKEDEIFVQYIFFLILKHMTNLKAEIPDTLDEQISIFNQLISIGLFEEMFNNVFDSNEVSKVLERIGAFSTLVEQIEEQAQKEFEQNIKTPLIPLSNKKAIDLSAEI